MVSGTDIKIPVLGFGCSSLTGVSRKDASKLLGNAFDAGIRHFDVARYYGYGEAERILGGFVKSRRAEVTITTKFGIQPPGRTSLLGLAVQIGGGFVRLLPRTRSFMQRRGKAFVRSGAFSVADAQKSLELSLLTLGTDFVDYYLLHDYEVDEHSAEDLVRLLEGVVKSGKVRHFGIGTSIDNVIKALEHQPELCQVIQFENSVLRRNVGRLPSISANRLVITHGSLSASYRTMLSFLTIHRDTAKDWSAKLDVDCSSATTLAALMLNSAIEMNQNGLVLFSTMNPTRVIQNTEAVLQSAFSTAQILLFGDLIKRDAAQLIL
jgi:D-threo-aldose 1-dehydrogenase